MKHFGCPLVDRVCCPEGKPSHQDCPASSELAGGKTETAGPWRLWPTLPLGAQTQRDQSSVPEPLAGVVGLPAGMLFPVRRDERVRPKEAMWPRPATASVLCCGEYRLHQAVQSPRLQKGKSVA